MFDGERKVKQSKRGKERGFLGKRRKVAPSGLAPGLSSRPLVLHHGQAIHGLQHKRLPRPRGPQSPRPRPDHPKPPSPREPPEAMGTLAALRELPTAADAVDPTAVL